MKHLIRVIGITVGILSVALLNASAAIAQVGAEPRTSARPDRIVGLWDVQVSVANCLGGPVFATFPALHKYELGGTGQVVPASNPALLSAHMMAWTHLSGDNYVSRFKMFRYDAAGNTIGWTIVTNEVSIDEDATWYTGSGIAESFDNGGNFLTASCPSFVGTRFGAEP
jgi:hypothetical protein